MLWLECADGSSLGMRILRKGIDADFPFIRIQKKCQIRTEIAKFRAETIKMEEGMDRKLVHWSYDRPRLESERSFNTAYKQSPETKYLSFSLGLYSILCRN